VIFLGISLLNWALLRRSPFGQRFTLLAVVLTSFDFVLPCDTEHVVVRAWAKDLKGLEGHDFAVIGAGNRPPEVRGKLYG